MADDIVTRLRTPQWSCICVDTVLANCSPCSNRLEAADEIERLRAELNSTRLLLQYLNDRLADFEGDTHGRHPT